MYVYVHVNMHVFKYLYRYAYICIYTYVYQHIYSHLYTFHWSDGLQTNARLQSTQPLSVVDTYLSWCRLCVGCHFSPFPLLGGALLPPLEEVSAGADYE